jgi:ketosteroid isomerase-like protein
MRALVLVAIVGGTAHAGDKEDIAKMSDAEIAKLSDNMLLPNAPVFTQDNVYSGSLAVRVPDAGFHLGTSKLRDRQIQVAGDGKSAWLNETAHIEIENDVSGTAIEASDWRISELVVKTPAGWRIAASVWTTAIPDATANKDAKAGKKKGPRVSLDDKASDASLRAAFGKLLTDGLDATAAARKDLVAIGSAPGERTNGGAIHAKAWAGWKGKATVTSSDAGVSPAGSTGWVAANVEVDKGGYKMPFIVFCVFEKTPKGEWSVVHSHFAVE